MTTTAMEAPAQRPSRRSVLIAGAVIFAIATLLFWQWRMVSQAGPGEVAEQDTMCLASRIGLPCR